jgi:hypothetical protein
MNKPVTIVRTIALVLGIIQLALGFGLWAGAKAITPIHITVGSLFVLSLWTLAVLAARRKVNIGLVVFSFVWGLIIPMLGMAQTSILPGSMHWIVQVVHLLFGVIGLYLVTALSARATSAAGQDSSASTVGR